MFKILIICDVYPPSFAPRMGYLVKYMKEWNFTADIVTRGQDDDFSFRSLVGDERVLRVRGLVIPKKTKRDKISRLLNQRSHDIQRGNLISSYILNNLKSKDYKFILCSTAHRTYILDAAYQIAKTWNMPWIADIRDLEEQKPTVNLIKMGLLELVTNHFNKDFKNFMLKKRNKRLHNANAVVTISPWHVERIKKHNTNVHLIYNGFCPEHFFPRPSKAQSTFKVTYMGLVISNEYRDPTLLFQAVKKLAEDKIIDKRYFRIQFFTPENGRGPILENPAYDAIQDFVDFFDYVDTSVVPKILADSSILLLLTNVFRADGPKGIMTTKYFEYLAMERPILCVRSDENLLEASIKKANAGIAARTLEETYDFIFEKWNEWQGKGYTTSKVNREYTQQFSRKLQATQFVELFKKMVVH